MMEQLIGTSFPVFFGITVVLLGFAAFMTGQGIANTWRPVWQIFPYAVLLAFASRFLIFALFDGELLSLSGYLIDACVLIAIALFAFRITRVATMVRQYPWMYERNGLFAWRKKG